MTHVLEGSVRKAGDAYPRHRAVDHTPPTAATSGPSATTASWRTLRGSGRDRGGDCRRALKARIRSRPAGRQPAPSLAAYRGYLKGRHIGGQSPRVAPRGRDRFEDAIDADPEFAHAYTGLGMSLLTLSMSACCRHTRRRRESGARSGRWRSMRRCRRRIRMLGVVSALYDYDWAEAEWLVCGSPCRVTRRPRRCAAPTPRFVCSIRVARARGQRTRAPRGHARPRLGAHLLGVALIEAGPRRGRDAEPGECVSSTKRSRRLTSCSDSCTRFPPFRRGADPCRARLRALARGIRWSKALFAVALGPTRATHMPGAGDPRTTRRWQRSRTSLGFGVFHLPRADLDRAADFMTHAVEERYPASCSFSTGRVQWGVRASPRWPARASCSLCRRARGDGCRLACAAAGRHRARPRVGRRRLEPAAPPGGLRRATRAGRR